MAPDGDIKEQFKFPMTAEGYREFAKMIPWEESLRHYYKVGSGDRKGIVLNPGFSVLDTYKITLSNQFLIIKIAFKR